MVCKHLADVSDVVTVVSGLWRFAKALALRLG